MHDTSIGISVHLALCNVINGGAYPKTCLIIPAWHPTTVPKLTFIIGAPVIGIGYKTIYRLNNEPTFNIPRAIKRHDSMISATANNVVMAFHDGLPSLRTT